MSKEVRIKLTDEQKAKIKKGTGQDLSEIRVSAVGANPAAASKQASARFAQRLNSLKINAAPRLNARLNQRLNARFSPRNSGTA